MAEWYYVKDGAELGPVDDAGLRQLAATGELLPTECVWKDGLPNWVEASKIPGLFQPRPLRAAAPPPAAPRAQRVRPASPTGTESEQWQASPVRRKPKKKSKKRVLLGCGAGLVVIIGVGAFFIVRSINAGAQRVRCLANISRINVAIKDYASAHDHHYPSELGDLLTDGKITSPDVFICPDSTDSPAPGPTPQEQAGNVVAGHTSYVYCGRDLTDQTAGADVVVLYENPPGHGGSTHFLFGDGHIDAEKPDQATQLIDAANTALARRHAGGPVAPVAPSDDTLPWASGTEGLVTDGAAGSWSFQDGTLSGQQASRGTDPATIALPVAPTGDFDFRVTFNRQSAAKAFGVMFPVDGHVAELSVGGGSDQATSIAGGRVFETGSAVQIATGKDQTLTITVRVTGQDADVSVKLDGHPWGNFRGKVDKLQQPIKSPRAGAIVLVVQGDAKVDFKDIRVRAVSGSIETVK